MKPMNELCYYAGIGSRQTPSEMLKTMTELAELLAKKGYTLRSGGAAGADQAFEKGSGSNKEIFLPRSDLPIWTIAFTMLYHPRPESLSTYAWQLMNRNAMQILGTDGNTPVDFVVCWTKDGKASGGTGQAIRIAKSLDIPVYNLYNNKEVSELANRIASLPDIA